MMLGKMGITFFLMIPFNETTGLHGLVSCSLSALQFQSRTISTKAKKWQKTQSLLHFTSIIIRKEKKKTVKYFSKIIKITETLSIKTLKT